MATWRLQLGAFKREEEDGVEEQTPREEVRCKKRARLPVGRQENTAVQFEVAERMAQHCLSLSASAAVQNRSSTESKPLAIHPSATASGQQQTISRQ